MYFQCCIPSFVLLSVIVNLEKWNSCFFDFFNYGAEYWGTDQSTTAEDCTTSKQIRQLLAWKCCAHKLFLVAQNSSWCQGEANQFNPPFDVLALQGYQICPLHIFALWCWEETALPFHLPKDSRILFYVWAWQLKIVETYILISSTASGVCQWPSPRECTFL